MSARLLMIGLDGADGGLIDRWSADGTLPALGALRERGATIRLSAPRGVSDDGLWASFQYAAGLGEHGRYHWIQRSASGAMRMTYRREIGRTSFWNELSDAGHRVAVFDVPKCGPPLPINGIHLTDWLVHGRYFPAPQSVPPSLAPEVVRRFGLAPPSRCGYGVPALSDAEADEVVSNLRKSVSQKRAAALHYLASEPWDLFLTAFKEAHCAGHHLWDLADPRHPDYDLARTERLGQPLRRIYQDLDAAVGDLISASGEDAAVAVFATTDMVPTGALGHLMHDVVVRVNRRLDEGVVARIARWAGERIPRAPSGWPCEVLRYNENCTALRVHASPLASERRVREIRGEVESLLRELVDADTGQPVVESVSRPSAEQAGRRARTLPDLLVEAVPGVVPRAVVSPRLGRVEAEGPPLRPGDHAAGGLLLCTEPEGRSVASLQDLGGLAAAVLAARAYRSGAATSAVGAPAASPPPPTERTS